MGAVQVVDEASVDRVPARRRHELERPAEPNNVDRRTDIAEHRLDEWYHGAAIEPALLVKRDQLIGATLAGSGGAA